MHRRVYKVRRIPPNVPLTRTFTTPSLWMKIGEREATRKRTSPAGEPHPKETQAVGSSSATWASSISATTDASNSGTA